MMMVYVLVLVEEILTTAGAIATVVTGGGPDPNRNRNRDDIPVVTVLTKVQEETHHCNTTIFWQLLLLYR